MLDELTFFITLQHKLNLGLWTAKISPNKRCRG